MYEIRTYTHANIYTRIHLCTHVGISTSVYTCVSLCLCRRTWWTRQPGVSAARLPEAPRTQRPLLRRRDAAETGKTSLGHYGRSCWHSVRIMLSIGTHARPPCLSFKCPRAGQKAPEMPCKVGTNLSLSEKWRAEKCNLELANENKSCVSDWQIGTIHGLCKARVWWTVSSNWFTFTSFNWRLIFSSELSARKYAKLFVHSHM